MSFNFFASSDILEIRSALFLIALAVVGICMLVLHCFAAAALYTIAKRRGVSAAYTAWLPIVKYQLLGKLAEQFELAQYGRTKPYRKLALGLAIAQAPLCLVFIALAYLYYCANEVNYIAMFSYQGVYFITLMVNYAAHFVNSLCYYKLFRSMSPSVCVKFLILGIIFGPFFTSFALFSMRHRDDGFIELNDRHYYGNDAQPRCERL